MKRRASGFLEALLLQKTVPETRRQIGRITISNIIFIYFLRYIEMVVPSFKISSGRIVFASIKSIDCVIRQTTSY